MTAASPACASRLEIRRIGKCDSLCRSRVYGDVSGFAEYEAGGEIPLKLPATMPITPAMHAQRAFARWFATAVPRTFQGIAMSNARLSCTAPVPENADSYARQPDGFVTGWTVSVVFVLALLAQNPVLGALFSVTP